MSPYCYSQMQGVGAILYSPILSSFDGMRSHGLQQRPWLLQSLNPDMGPNISPGPDIIVALFGNETTRVSPHLISFSTSDLLLPTGY